MLHAFEAAARTQSFTLAAHELSLTQSAVSRQIRALEEMLGAPLFHREKQKVYLTLAGNAYAREIRVALARISNATLGFRGNPLGGSLNLAVLPLFGARWLMPRLPAFLAQYPDITVNLTTRLAPFDFGTDAVDAAVHFGLREWPGAGLDLLMRERTVALCSPALKAEWKFSTSADLIAAPLLHLVSRPDAWERWFAAQNIAPGEIHGMLLDQLSLSIEAARAGLGVALVPDFLAVAELAQGHLVEAATFAYEGAESYYLAWPETHGGYPPLAAFRAWIGQEKDL
ncbi:LysR family transcriptional regulator [Sphingopyxis panaciterrae]